MSAKALLVRLEELKRKDLYQGRRRLGRRSLVPLSFETRQSGDGYLSPGRGLIIRLFGFRIQSDFMRRDKEQHEKASDVSQQNDGDYTPEELDEFVKEETRKGNYPAEDYWLHDKHGNQLFELGVMLAITCGPFTGYTLRGPIPPEVAKWVLANLPERMVDP
jgi:hypothetical protein